MRRQTKEQKAAYKRIDKIFNATCQNIQISVMDIPKIFLLAEGWITAEPGITDADLGTKIVGYVETIRKD